MKITVYGCGYVGLVTAALLADSGNDVLGIDVDSSKVAALTAGKIPIYEPGLEAVVARNLAAGRLRFCDEVTIGAQFGLLQFVAVGTPACDDGSADLRYVLQVAKQIGEHIDGDAVIIDKSTVPVGTADKVKAVIADCQQKRRSQHHIAVVSNPEFLKEGAAINDFMRPDRIVIGSDDDWATELLRELYAPFNRNHDRIIVMDVHSAELSKYAANAMLATKISFINEMSRIAEAVGADIESVRQGIGADPRIGYDFIYAGCGYGGSCFPKDVRALSHTATEHDIDIRLINAVTQTNDIQKQVLFEKISRYFGDTLSDRHLAIWGLAFKPNTDDLREAPALTLLESLWAAGVKTTVYDPQAMHDMKKRYPDQPLLHYSQQPMAACKDADALVIVTEWREFKSPDFDYLSEQLAAPVIFDGRNLYAPKRLERLGFRYFAIGRGEVY